MSGRRGSLLPTCRGYTGNGDIRVIGYLRSGRETLCCVERIEHRSVSRLFTLVTGVGSERLKQSPWQIRSGNPTCLREKEI